MASAVLKMHTFHCDIWFYMKLSLDFKMLIIALEKYPNFLYLKHFFCHLNSETPVTGLMIMMIKIWLRQ